MNKGKRLLCLVLTMILIFSNALPVAAFSTEPAAPAQTTTQAVDADNGETVSEMKTHVLTSGSKEDLAKVKSYNVSVPPTNEDEYSSRYEAVVPIKITKKGFLISAFAFDSSSHPDAYSPSVDIYKDANCTESIYGSTSDGLTIYEVEKAGTYYVKFKVNDSSSDGVTPYDFKFLSQLADGSDRTLTNNKVIYSANLDTSKNMYYKVVVKKTGTLTLTFDSDSSIDVTLCNSKKKAISDECYVYKTTPKKATFAVKKGTYYYRVNSSSEYNYVKSTFKAMVEKGGATKKKARTLKLGGSAVTAPVIATNSRSKVYWYKFYNSKSHTAVVTFKGKVTSGEIEIEFFNAKGESYGDTSLTSYSDDASFKPYVSSFYSSKGVLPKGTYYMKITKKTTKSSGYYSIKVK